MRAFRVAAGAFGAVVALSCIFGFAPRTDATVGSEPVATASSAATTEAATPVTEPPAPESSAPVVTPPPATPAPPAPLPTTNDYHAIPTITVDGFTPAGGKATFTATGGADHGTAALYFQGGSVASRGCTWTSGGSCQPYRSLSAGSWRLDAIQSWSGTPYVSSPRSLSFVVPEAPTLAVGAGEGGSSGFTLSGTGGHDGDLIHVSLTDGTAVCDATVGGGSWTCGDVVAPSAAGSYDYRALEQDVDSCASHAAACDCGTYLSGGLSAYSATAEFVVAPVEPTPTPTPTAAPTPTATPAPAPTPSAPPKTRTSTQLTTLATWSFDVAGVNLAHVHPGDHFVVSGSELPPGSIVAGELHSKVVSLGSVVVGSDGTLLAPGCRAERLRRRTARADHVADRARTRADREPAGCHRRAGEFRTDERLGGAVAEPRRDRGIHGCPRHARSEHHRRREHEHPDARPEQHRRRARSPAEDPAALEIGLVLLIFAILPAHLLNATLAEQYEKFRARMPLGRRRTPLWWERLRSATTRAPFLAGVGLTTVTALLFGFADPRFGITLASLRLFLGLAIALAVVTYLVNVVVGRVMQARWAVDVEISIRPLGLVLTLVGVVISRLLDFSPGFLVGLVLGLVIAEKAVKAHAWRAVLLRSSILLGLALIAWLAFSLFDSSQEGGTFASELAVETLVAITTEAVVGLMVELLPLKLLEGEKLFQKSKLVWGGLYLLAVFIFVVAVVPWEGNWEELGNSLWAWIGIVVGFGVIATGVYLFFRIRRSLEPEQHDDDELVPVGSEGPIEADAGE